MSDDYKPAWRNVKGAIDELVIGGQVIQASSKSRNADMDSGPFYSRFDLTGETFDEMKADAIRQGYAKMLKSIEEYVATAADLGVDLSIKAGD